MMRIGLATTHPIQYQAPWFRALAARPELEVEVGFAWIPDAAAQGDGFGVAFDWDLPLREGYRSVELERVGSRPSLSRFGGLRLRDPAAWLAGRFDALLVTGWNARALLQVALAARRNRLPVVARGDSRGGLRRPLVVRLAHRALLRLYAAFLVVGRRNRDFYRGYGISPARLFDAPHFVDNDRFARARAETRARRAELRERWGVPAAALGVLFAGKLQEVKRVDLLLAALAEARASAPCLHAMIAGEGAERPRLEALAAAARVPVSWLGFLNQRAMPEAYAAADLLVLPSRSETWGLVVNEAMASGLPALVSDAAGCAPDLVVEGETGWTFPSGDRPALAAALVRAASPDAGLARLGESAARRVATSYSIERAVEGTVAALASVAGRA
jgi:glycosyltransferase involved in cell wall biosynthesis